LSVAVTAAVLASGSKALAQQSYDHPTLKGGNSRQGHNGDPSHNSPGASYLRWWYPSGLGTTIVNPIIDNTDTLPVSNSADDNGPFDTNPYGTSRTVGAWFGPPSDQEASMSYLVPVRRAAIGAFPINFNSRTPSYAYSKCVPSRVGSDPRLAAPGTTRTSFTWRFTGIGTTPKNYAIWVNIPVGATGPVGDRHFPQRFFVYDITYGPDAADHYVDVVDTYVSGGGWVRLGGAGYPNSMVFPYNGSTAIRVTLYNTVPRDSEGKLTMPTTGNTAGLGLDKFYVYGDACRLDPATGEYSASPSSSRTVDADPNSAYVTGVNNELTVGLQNSILNVLSKAVITTYKVNTGVPMWRYSPPEEYGVPAPVVKDDEGASATAAFTQQGATFPHFGGNTASTAAISNNAGAIDNVHYAPGSDLTAQTYEIYVYLPGDFGTTHFGTRVTYNVHANGLDYVYRLDQSLPRGWVKLGDRRFQNVPGSGEISVDITNYSPLGTDSTKLAYADAIKFVGERNFRVTSTPIHATAQIRKTGGALETTKVVVVADENGTLHCLDAIGKPDGTTTEYWTYPSLRDSKGYDPNLGTVGGTGIDYSGDKTIAAADRIPTAEMPQGFDLSSGLIQTINGLDYLFIGSANGRVYCIEMAGRGDYNSVDPISTGSRTTGTTSRSWTYPATTPTPNPVVSSPLLSVKGSVAYGEPNSIPTIYIPTTAGRMYAVRAVGRPNRSTTLRWAFPAETDQHLGPIVTTPVVAFGRVYFGTQRNPLPSGDVQGQFYSLNWNTGAVGWSYQATDDFRSSPASASLQDLTPTNTTTTRGLIYALNENHTVYAFDSQTGAIAWNTDELGAGAEASMSFSWQTVYNNIGVLQPFPVVLVPTTDGHIRGLFARTADINRFGTRLCSSFTFQGDSARASLDIQGTVPTTNPTADAGTGWMMAADNVGYLYAFNNTQGYLSQGQAPGSEDLVPNNPIGDIFRKAKLRIITQQTYQKLRLPTSLTAGVPDADHTYRYQDVPASTMPNAFEWGQTAYILVYDFPFLTENSANNAVDPPVVNVSFNVDGKTIRGIAVASRQFSDPDNSPKYNDALPTTSIPAPDGDIPMDGYAILAFPFQNSGANSLPPGDGEISISISTSALSTSNVQQNVLLDPGINKSRFPFKIANPLAVVVAPPGGQLASNYEGAAPAASAFTFGLSNDPANPENTQNGSFDIGGKRASLMGAATPITAHGGSGKAVVWIIDRSMMALLRPEPLTQGLDGVRLDRRDLGWQGGQGSVYKRLSKEYPSLAGYEDLPVNSPNTSLDYPDIHSERISATKSPSGNSENPLFNGVTLLPPLKADGSAIDEATLPGDRVFRATPFLIDVDVPKYQPANTKFNLTNNASAALIPSSDGISQNEQGYIGRIDVFVDSVQNGRLDSSVREAYRSFNLSTGVDADQKITVTTPTVDLGTLAGGTGYFPGITPGTGFAQAATPFNVFQPWKGAYASVFKGFGVQNEGNVNLLNVRIAKEANITGYERLTLGGTETDPFSWLDGKLDVWSDIDPNFNISPVTGGKIFVPKPRVQDRIGTDLQSNPVRRQNANLGTTGVVTIAGKVVTDTLNQTTDGAGQLFFQHAGKFTPVIGASVPIGFPVGKYQERVRVFEDWEGAGTGDWIWNNQSANSPESYTEPGFLLSFGVGETRLTNSFDPFTAPMIDNLTPNGSFTNSNVQPAAARDAFGNLVLAFASNRPNWTSTIGTADSGAYRLYLSSLDSGATFSTNQGGSFATPNPATGALLSPLRDLNVWNAASTSNWFKQGAGGYPAGPDASLFGLQGGESLVPGSVRYGNPSFPSAGAKDPFVQGNNFTGMYMAFTGQAQKRNADNTVENASRLMLGIVTPGADGTLGVSAPAVLNDNPQAVKGRAAIVQSGGSGTSKAVIFVPETQSGSSSILYTRYSTSGGFTQPQPLPFGSGFSSVSSPSAVGRIQAPMFPTQINMPAIIELTFQGKLRGRANSEVFMGRLSTADGGSSLVEDSNGVLDQEGAFAWLTPQSGERIVADSEPGLFRVRGVVWNTSMPITLTQVVNGTVTDLLVPGSGVFDQQTKVISYNTRLGGKVYMDPMLGTVRFSNGSPSSGTRLLLSYTPRFIRLSSGGSAGYSDPVVLYDDRFISDPAYWRTPADLQANYNTRAIFVNRFLSNDRTVVTFNRAAASGGQTARPYMFTMRYGVRLDFQLPTLANGAPGFSQGNQIHQSVAGVQFNDPQPKDSYQIDPAQGKIYFPSSNEGRVVTISYYGKDDSGNFVVDGAGNPLLLTKTAIVGLVGEDDEAPIPIETSVNESNLVPALDPFTYRNVSPDPALGVYRRPPLIWMFWTSTRNGSPDIYFESIAPRMTPIPVGH